MAFDGLGPIGQVALSVGDVEEGVAYYGERLGLRLLFEAGGMAFFDCGGLRLMLGPSEAGESPVAGDTILYFEVPDIGSAHEVLLSRDVEFVEAPRKVAELEETELWLAFFRDPWGHVHGLMSEVPM